MTDAGVRRAAVAGAFYPADARRLGQQVGRLLEEAPPCSGRPVPGGHGLPLGILVPHAGLVYSGVTAAAGWTCLDVPGGAPPTVVVLGTNHAAGWLDGVGVWDDGSWERPGGETGVDAALTAEVLSLGPPYVADRAAHLGEHSIEVHLPLLAAVAPGARVVPLAVACGTGDRALRAGDRLGRLLAAHRAAGEPVVLAISTDMAHYPAADACAMVTDRLAPAIVAPDPARLVVLEGTLRRAGIPGLVCGMCGIEPAVLGLASLLAMGAGRGSVLHASTSADAGGPPDRTVGYLAVRFDA